MIRTTRFLLSTFMDVSLPIKDEEFMPVLQGWIQRDAVPGGLVDVAFYGHVRPGPVVLLCGLEGNYEISRDGDRYAFHYQSKRDSADRSFEERVAEGAARLKMALDLLERDPLLGGWIRAKRAELEFSSNDRLELPNSSNAFDSIRVSLEKAAVAFLGGVNSGAASIATRVSNDPRARLTVKLTPAA